MVYGSPVNPCKQLHAGIWLKTLHSALFPHDPGQGSLHFCLIQALSVEQSEWILHSARQFGGLPI